MQARAEQHHELVWIRKKIGDQAWNDSAAKRRGLGFRFTSLELGRWDQAVKGRRRQSRLCNRVCKADVQALAPAVLSAVVEDGLLWFAYPKKSGAVKSDLSRDIGWEPVFAGGFDSVAQISIDETWTGFRFRPKHLVGKRPR
jgi:hypothetical protein